MVNIIAMYVLRITRLNHARLLLLVDIRVNYCQYYIIIFVNVGITLVLLVNVCANVRVVFVNIMLSILFVSSLH